MRLSFERSAAWLQPRLWYALVAGALIWSIWFCTTVLNGGKHDAMGNLIGVDHLAFYSPARMIREGRGSEIYDAYQLWQYQTNLFPPGFWVDEYEAYRNPPFYALLYYPTAGLSYYASCWIWIVVSLLALIAGVHLLKPTRPWRTLLWVASFLPVFNVIGYGQNSLLSFAVLCGTYACLQADRRFLAGLLAGLLWFKPPLLVGLVIWGIVDLRKLWPCALGVVITGAALTFGTYPFIPDAWDAFVQSLQTNVKFEGFELWKMHNARAFWKLLVPGQPLIAEILWLVCAAFAVCCFVRIRNTNRENLPTLFAASTLLMLWISPHTMIYEWSLAAIPAVLLWNHQPERRTIWKVLFAVGWAALAVGTELSRAQVWLEGRLHWQPTIVVQFSVIALGWVGLKATVALTSPNPDDDGSHRESPNGVTDSSGSSP